MNDVWKWVAGILIALGLGAGGSTLYGRTALAEQAAELAEYKKDHAAEMDKIHLHQAEIHSRLTDKLEDLKELMHSIQLSQADLEAKMDILLQREFAAHHSEGDGS